MPQKKTTLYSGASQYGTYKVVDTVYDGRPARLLYGDSRSPQSGVAKDDDPALLFDYNQRFMEIIMSERPKKLLVIGGGAFMLPIAAFYRFPDMVIDVVEIDSLLVKLSEDFFDLPKDKRLRIHIEDGAAFVKRTRQRYDMIIIDAFSGYTIPPHLLEHETLLQYKKRLKRGGVVAVNFISEYKRTRRRLAHELVAGMSEVFPQLALYPAGHDYPRGEEQNLVLTAARKPLHFDYLHSDVLELFDS